MRQQGFTLIEVLMSMALFGLLISVVYAAIGPAGDGFIQLQESRDKLEQRAWAERQLRSDISYLSATHDLNIEPISVTYDSRGDTVFDELWLLVKERGHSSLSFVHYFIDEESGMLVRESKMAWARSEVEALRWNLGQADSFDVELLNPDGQWNQNWDMGEKNAFWPVAIRIKFRDELGERMWNYPLWTGKQP